MTARDSRNLCHKITLDWHWCRRPQLCLSCPSRTISGGGHKNSLSVTKRRGRRRRRWTENYLEPGSTVFPDLFGNHQREKKWGKSSKNAKDIGYCEKWGWPSWHENSPETLPKWTTTTSPSLGRRGGPSKLCDFCCRWLEASPLRHADLQKNISYFLKKIKIQLVMWVMCRSTV